MAPFTHFATCRNYPEEIGKLMGFISTNQFTLNGQQLKQVLERLLALLHELKVPRDGTSLSRDAYAASDVQSVFLLLDMLNKITSLPLFRHYQSAMKPLIVNHWENIVDWIRFFLYKFVFCCPAFHHELFPKGAAFPLVEELLFSLVYHGPSFDRGIAFNQCAAFLLQNDESIGTGRLAVLVNACLMQSPASTHAFLQKACHPDDPQRGPKDLINRVGRCSLAACRKDTSEFAMLNVLLQITLWRMGMSIISPQVRDVMVDHGMIASAAAVIRHSAFVISDRLEITTNCILYMISSLRLCVRYLMFNLAQSNYHPKLVALFDQENDEHLVLSILSAAVTVCILIERNGDAKLLEAAIVLWTDFANLMSTLKCLLKYEQVLKHTRARSEHINNWVVNSWVVLRRRGLAELYATWSHFQSESEKAWKALQRGR